MGEITFKEYKCRVDDFFKKVKEKLLVNCEKSEVYQVESHFRDNLVNDYQKHLYSRVFKKYDNVRGFIEIFDDNIASEDCDTKDFEYLSDGCYYEICKYRLLNNDEYEKIFTLTIVNFEDCLEFVFNIGMENYFNSIEKELYNEWKKLSNLSFQREGRLEIAFPFSKGDIIEVDGKPFQSKSRYYVYCNSSRKCISKDYWERLCIKELFSHCDLVDYNFFVPYYVKKVYSCEDIVLQNLSKFVSTSSDDEVEKLLNTLQRQPDETPEDFDKRMQEFEKKFMRWEAEK